MHERLVITRDNPITLLIVFSALLGIHALSRMIRPLNSNRTNDNHEWIIRDRRVNHAWTTRVCLFFSNQNVGVS